MYSRAVYDDVDAVFDRLLQVRRPKRRVHDRHCSGKTLPKLSELFQVKNCDVWIAWCLAVQNLNTVNIA